MDNVVHLTPRFSWYISKYYVKSIRLKLAHVYHFQLTFADVKNNERYGR